MSAPANAYSRSTASTIASTRVADRDSLRNASTSSARTILALDASTEIASVCLTDGTHWTERREDAGQRHSAIIMEMIRAVLDEAACGPADLDEVAFGAGPGSFTGLRIACGIAQGIGYGAGIPVRGVSSLLAVAQASGAVAVLSAIDARMNEVYWGAYRRAPHLPEVAVLPSPTPTSGRWIEIVAPRASPADAVRVPDGDDWAGAGNAFGRFTALATVLPSAARVDPAIDVTARAIAELALGGEGMLDDASRAMPVYVRDKVAMTSAERALR